MENASKALLIVASTLVGIMLISLMVYLFGNFKAELSKKSQTERIILLSL